MTTTDHPTTDQASIDPDAVMTFVHRAVDEAGSALNCALIVMGDQLGYYRDLAAHGPTTPADLATRTGTDERYAREWLRAQAAGGIVTYAPGQGTFSLPAEHAVALADEDSPFFLPGLFQTVQGTIHDAPQIIADARTGAGVGWHAHHRNVHLGCERFFRPSYRAHLVDSWLPALDGVVAKLERGASVADVGCGHGASTVLMAQAFARSRFTGVDSHVASVETARRRAAAAGVSDRVTFTAADARSIDGRPYDLVTMFDCLHDMGDPVGTARQIHDVLAPDGTWMIVEPMAGDRVEDNFNPVGRTYYGFSTLLCTPSSLSQDVGAALGTQAGPARLSEVIRAGGFATVRQVAQTPFNLVLEATP
ncbi:class I SAM-dependent methyltransferase [Ruania zhangjianzhongii]|uniref:class I SAM-dependent methyltransferase n=1 Tax=Ruania zhangjianzhongii TaxID=2603206 RepID=UPI0011C9A359|nr:class I SAM-dependent methyltransferase [Ruania zhangjianzhongii]